MNKINSFKDLLVWQKGMEIVKLVYAISSNFPKEEIFGLTSQIRRAATSIPLNIAEGYGRSSRLSYRSFIRIARSSNQELETAMEIALMLEFVSDKDVVELKRNIEEESRMLNSLIQKLSDEQKDNK